MISSSAPSTAVVLFNLGGLRRSPRSSPLVNLFSDREIIELPSARGCSRHSPAIARLRGPSVRRDDWIGGGAPQLIHRGQAGALERTLNGNESGTPFRVFIAMRYSKPSADDALDAIAEAGIRRVVTLSLFPHYSVATTGSSRKEFERAFARRPRSPLLISHIDDYADDERYLDAMTGTVRAALQRVPLMERLHTVLLFSAHGLPQRFIDRGDPYVERIALTMDGIRRRLALPNRHVLAYQSRTGPVKWIGPGTDKTLEALGSEGVRSVLVVPLSFVSDHIETLYEVDQLFAETARRAGITGYYRSAALNASPAFIASLAALVRRQLSDGRPWIAPPAGVALPA